MHTPTTLKEVAEQFQQWRSTKLRKSEPIPPALASLVASLLPKYTKQQVMATLRLNSSTLKSLLKRTSHHKKLSPKEMSFIPVQINDLTLSSATAPTSATCEIINSKGTKLIIHSPDVKSIINAFLCCS